MNGLDFTIQHWHAWTPAARTGPATGAEADDRPVPDLSAFPALMRRRLSASGKAAIHCLLKIRADVPDLNSNTPAVFCTHYGEAVRSARLLDSIASRQALSPTDFSLSVHNAVAGVYSIGMKQTGNVTAIGTSDGGLVAALVETIGILEDSGHERALCIVYDEPLPDCYPTGMNRYESEAAIAILVSRADADAPESAQPLRLIFDDAEQTADVSVEPADFASFLMDRSRTSFELSQGRSRWLCLRRA